MWKLTFKCTPNKTLNEIDFQACGHIPHAWLPYMKHLSAESIYMGHSFLIKQVEHIKICRKENTPQKSLKGVVRISHSSCHWCQILLVVYSFTHRTIPKENGLTLQMKEEEKPEIQNIFLHCKGHSFLMGLGRLKVPDKMISRNSME